MLSLILPSYNVGPYIAECIESALQQTIAELEIICVDAHSNDGTLTILKNYKKRVDRGEWPGKKMELFLSDKKSYGYQVNLALKAATGKYVAILETDDYVEESMYEKLVNLSEEMHLDYIRGEYDFFTTKEDGSREFHHVHHYAPTGKVLEDVRSEYIMTYDQNLWKGIYRRDFLMENKIFLNESEGASFQDIGFNMQVFSYARRAYYVEESFYRYRRDREGSSIHSLDCFRFYVQELKFLHDLDPDCEKLYWPGIYERFSCALCGEYHKAKKKISKEEEEQYLAPYMPILIGEFDKAMEKKIWPAPQTPAGQVKAVLKICEEIRKKQ